MQDAKENKMTAEQFQIAEYSPTAAALAELKARLKDVAYDLSTTKGLDMAKKDRAEVRGLRTSLEAKRVEIKSPALERCRLIDAEAKRITAELEALEKPIDQQIKAEEARKEAERQAKLKAEAERVSTIQARIQEIERMPLALVGQASAAVSDAIASVSAMDLSAELFAEFYGQASAAKAATLQALGALLNRAEEAEATARRLEEVRALLAEQKRQQEAAEAERQAQARKEQEEAAAKLRAEREDFERQQAAARAEQQARDAAAAAERKAEQDKLDAARAEFERQQREAREAEEFRQAAARAEEEKRQAEARAIAEEQERERLAKQAAEDELQAAKARAEAEEKRRQDVADHADVIQAFLKTRPEDEKTKQHIRPWLVMFCRFQDGLQGVQQEAAA